MKFDGSSVSFQVGPRYTLPITASNTERGPIECPDSYASPFRFIKAGKSVVSYAGGNLEAFCYRCSFRPWADSGSIARAKVTVRRVSGGIETVPAMCDADGFCTAPIVLAGGDQAFVARGDVVDEFGEFNGHPGSL